MFSIGINQKIDFDFLPIISVIFLNFPLLDISLRIIENNEKKYLCDVVITIFGMYFEYCRCNELSEKGINIQICKKYKEE